MNRSEAAEAHRWRLLDREVQDVHHPLQVRAQTVLDVAEDSRRIAAARGTDPLDDLLDLYVGVISVAAKRMVADAMSYLRAETHLDVRSRSAVRITRVPTATG